ncbi:MAG: NAD(P)/FAD-dependent oxidoreductase [bacterium]
MSRDPVVIIGAGLAGLSAAATLFEMGVEFILLEAEGKVGGLCRTERAGDFLFDHTGHLLHLKEGPVREFVLDRIGDLLVMHKRRASVYVEGIYVPYPIQANFGKLSPPTVKRCIETFRMAGEKPIVNDPDFVQWSTAQFGEGLSELFMIPYNRKLFVHPIEELETSWTSWSVPRPGVDDMERAASGEDTGSFGYNVDFYYPSGGGIDVLPEKLAGGTGDSIRLNSRVTAVDPVAKTVTVGKKEVVGYRNLISTMPLSVLAETISGAEVSLKRAAGYLRCSSVLALCLGLDGPVPMSEHWIYFPEESFPFYRVGFPTNFSDSVAPEGCGSMYIEIAHMPGEDHDKEKLSDNVLCALWDAGVISADVNILASLFIPIPCAYVFYDRYRKKNIKRILSELASHSILSVGRYGAWEYSSMQDAIAWGLKAGREVTA